MSTPTTYRYTDDERVTAPIHVPSHTAAPEESGPSDTDGFSEPTLVDTDQSAGTPPPAATTTEDPDLYVPDRGWQKFRYAANRMLGRPERLLPLHQLNAEQRDDIVQKAYDTWKKQTEYGSVEKLRSLTDLAPIASFAFINTKGSAATTTTTVNAACILGNATQAMVIVLDANPASGTSARRLGKDHGQTITVQEVANSYQELNESFEAFIRRARPNRYGVRSISAASIVSKQSRLTRDSYRKVLDITKRNCEYLFVDTANDIISEESLQILHDVHVFVFTANVGEPDSLRQLGTSMQSLREYGFEEKVNNSVVVVSNMPHGAKLQYYRKFLHHVSMQDEVIMEYPGFKGSFLGVPRDLEVARASEVQLEEWEWETAQAYRDLDIVMLEQATKIKVRPQAAPTLSETPDGRI